MLLLLSFALAASPPSALVQAADAERGELERMAAFQSLVTQWSSLGPELREIAVDQDADARHRWVAIRVIGQIKEEESLLLLLKLCEDPMAAIRVGAASALGDLGNRSVVGTLAGLLQDPAILVRAAAADALGTLRDPSAIADLGRALEDPSNYYRGAPLWSRQHYVSALEAIGDPRACAYLVPLLNDPDPNVARMSVEALESITGRSFSKGRSPEQEQEAWRRWLKTQ